MAESVVAEAYEKKSHKKISVLLTTAMLKRADAIGEHVNGMAEMLIERGHHVAVACNNADFPDRRYPVYEAFNGDILKVMKQRYDVILAGISAIDAFKPLGPIMRFNTGAKFILDHHCITPITYIPRIGMKLQLIAEHAAARFAALYADCIFAHSEFTVEEASRWPGAKGKVKRFDYYIKSLYKMLDIDECKAKMGITGKAALYVGRLERHKRIDFLIDAFAKLDCKDATLLIVGGGGAQKELEEKIIKCGLGERVKLLGRLPDDELLACYNAADVVATASIHEGYCVPVVEAFACGTPFVGTNVTALPGTIGKYGATFEVNDLDGLASSLKKYLDWTREDRQKFRKDIAEYNKKFTRAVVLNAIVDELEAQAGK